MNRELHRLNVLIENTLKNKFVKKTLDLRPKVFRCCGQHCHNYSTELSSKRVKLVFPISKYIHNSNNKIVVSSKSIK